MRQVLKYLNLPDVMRHTDGSAVTAETWRRRREEILEILEREMYGRRPPEPDSVHEVSREPLESLYGGAVAAQTVTLELSYRHKTFRFPVTLTYPAEFNNPTPIITIGTQYSERYLASPPEELYRRGFAVLHVWCRDITADSQGYSDGLPAVLFPEGRRPGDAAKLLIWARCMAYARTYLEERGGFNMADTAYAGCSRFGKTALCAGVFDERVRNVVSVCSGTAGGAIVRGKVGETVGGIYNYAPHWFCERYGEYGGREDELPFDAHFIVAALAPRNILVTGGLEDYWCDPYWEMLSCIAGSPAHELLGKPGFIYEGPHPVPGYRYPVPGDFFNAGNIAYFMRAGGHGFFPEDWLKITEFITSKQI